MRTVGHKWRWAPQQCFFWTWSSCNHDDGELCQLFTAVRMLHVGVITGRSNAGNCQRVHQRRRRPALWRSSPSLQVVLRIPHRATEQRQCRRDRGRAVQRRSVSLQPGWCRRRRKDAEAVTARGRQLDRRRRVWKMTASGTQQRLRQRHSAAAAATAQDSRRREGARVGGGQSRRGEPSQQFQMSSGACRPRGNHCRRRGSDSRLRRRLPRWRPLISGKGIVDVVTAERIGTRLRRTRARRPDDRLDRERRRTLASWLQRRHYINES